MDKSGLTSQICHDNYDEGAPSSSQQPSVFGENDRILLANLFPPSQANLSAQAFPWSCALHEAIRKARFSTLPSSATVSDRFRQSSMFGKPPIKRIICVRINGLPIFLGRLRLPGSVCSQGGSVGLFASCQQ